MSLSLSLSSTELLEYMNNLLRFHFPSPSVLPDVPISAYQLALERLEYCFKHIKKKYYYSNGTFEFNHLNGDHMCTFLWFLSNSIWQISGDPVLPSAFSYLNKILHSVDIFYSVPMPDIYLLIHPVGSVFGSASYSDYFVAYQNCTIGADKGLYPVLSNGVVCYSRSSIIGSCHIGSNVVLAANTLLLNTDVPDFVVVSGSYPTNKLTQNKHSTVNRIFTDF